MVADLNPVNERGGVRSFCVFVVRWARGKAYVRVGEALTIHTHVQPIGMECGEPMRERLFRVGGNSPDDDDDDDAGGLGGFGGAGSLEKFGACFCRGTSGGEKKRSDDLARRLDVSK